MDFQIFQVLAMRRKGFLIQQAALAGFWVLLGAVLLAVPGQTSWPLALMLIIALLATLLLNTVRVWWLSSQVRRDRVLEGMLSYSPVLLWSFDPHGIVTRFHGRESILGDLSAAAVLNTDIRGHFSARSSFRESIERALKGESLTAFHELDRCYSRHHFRPFWSRTGALAGVDCVSVDITRERRLLDRVAVAQKLFDHAGDALVVADSRRRILTVNPAFTEVTRFPANEIIGLKLSFPTVEALGVHFYRTILRTLRAGNPWRGEIAARQKDGNAFAAVMTLVPIGNRRGDIVYYLAFLGNAAVLEESQDELRYLANHDALTGLPNRRLFLDRLNQAIRRARRWSRKLAIYFLDLDHFKTVNDTHGHAVGDVLLKEVAARLRRVVRESDTVARFAGDEFTILTEEVESDEQIHTIAEKILELFHEPFLIEGHTIHSGTSIGVATFPTDGAEAQELLKAADLAMYRAKEEGRGRYHAYSQHRYLIDHQERQMARVDLASALEGQELSLVYQPIVSIDCGEVIGCEALLRWNHRRYGVLLPGDFIAIAEEAGLMPSFGDWVLRTACSQILSWQQRGHPLTALSINLSRDQLCDPHFAQRLLAILTETGFAPAQLVLEMKENVVLECLENVTGLINTLSPHGIRFSIDDFGTGTSAYSYLKSLPVHLLKIDHRILNESRQPVGNDGFIRAMVSLADLMGLEVVVGGIEREPQERFLRELGCDLGQGYLYGHPLDADDFASLLTASSGGASPETRPSLH